MFQKRRKKLDDCGEKTIFIGYEQEDSNGYKLYNPIIKKGIVSKDAIFDEEHAWNWESKEQSPERKKMESQPLFRPLLKENIEPQVAPTQEVAARQNLQNTRRPRRNIQPPPRLRDFVATPNHDFDDDDDDSGGNLIHFAMFAYSGPITFEKTMKDKKWVAAMNDEMKSIKRNNTW